MRPNHEFAPHVGHAIQEIHPTETNYENESNQTYPNNNRPYDVMPPGIEPPPPGSEGEASLAPPNRYSRERDWNDDYKNTNEKSDTRRQVSGIAHSISVVIRKLSTKNYFFFSLFSRNNIVYKRAIEIVAQPHVPIMKKLNESITVNHQRHAMNQEGKQMKTVNRLNVKNEPEIQIVESSMSKKMYVAIEKEIRIRRKKRKKNGKKNEKKRNDAIQVMMISVNENRRIKRRRRKKRNPRIKRKRRRKKRNVNEIVRRNHAKRKVNSRE